MKIGSFPEGKGGTEKEEKKRVMERVEKNVKMPARMRNRVIQLKVARVRISHHHPLFFFSDYYYA